jgi:hypothetical protein
MVTADDGPNLFAQLLTDEGMKSVEQQLSADRSARNFRRPTGHIYTESQLLVRLQRAIESQSKRKVEVRRNANSAE